MVRKTAPTARSPVTAPLSEKAPPPAAVTPHTTAGNHTGTDNGSAAVGGNNELASDVRHRDRYRRRVPTRTFGNDNTAIADTNYTVDNAGVGAHDGNGNYAYVDGPDNSTADASRRQRHRLRQ